jgi:DNA polymerase V
MIYAVPRMSYYLQMSSKVVSIFLDFVAEEDLHVYSVDESFLNLAPYLNLYHCTPEELVQRIQKTIKDKLGLVATAGIGPNMFLAKIALDVEGKKKRAFFARWDYQDVPTKLWSISPITEIWGIARGTSTHLARIGIRSLYELAHASALLEKEFGVMGKQLQDLANGRDESNIEEKYVPENVSLSNGQTLRRALSRRRGLLLLREMVDELCTGLERQLPRWPSQFLGQLWGKGNLRQATWLCQLRPMTRIRSMPQSSEVFSYAPLCLSGGFQISFGHLTQSKEEQISLFLDDETRRRKKKTGFGA